MNIAEDFKKAGRVIAVDTETAMAPRAFEGRDCVRLVQVYSPQHEFWYDLAEFSDDDWHELRIWLEDPALRLIFQNAAFDLRVLQGCGINICGKVEDTMLQSYLLHNGIPTAKHNLAAIAFRELGIKLDKSLQKSDWMNADLTEEEIEYGMNDVRVTYQSFFSMADKIARFDLEVPYEVEIKAILPTVEMEATGINLDRAAMDDLAKDLEETRATSLAAFVEGLDSDLREYNADPLPRHADGRINLNKKTTGSVRLGTKQYAGFNPGSSQQLLARFNAIGIDPTDPLGKPSVDKKYLAAHTERAVIRDYLSWKRADKHLQMCATLTGAQAENGRIYGRFNQTGTFTGRYSSSNPNLQNIPRGDMRFCFTAPEGRELVDLDFSGMELRALCSPRIANEPAMAAAFCNGDDVHRATAALMFRVDPEEITDEERRQAKAVNFGAAYGSGPQGLVNYFQSLGQLISFEEGKAFLNAWLEAYPNILSWHNNCRELVKQGESVVMVDGRQRHLIGDAARHTIYCNNVVQGSCASVMKLALYGIHQNLRTIDESARLVAVIHDEVLIECDHGNGSTILDMAREQMKEAGAAILGTEVPMEADGAVGASWGAAH